MLSLHQFTASGQLVPVAAPILHPFSQEVPMKRVLLISALTLFWWQPSTAQSPFDFDGTWRLDPARSQSTGYAATMVISTAADAIRVDTNYDGIIVRTVFPLFADEPQPVGTSWQDGEGDPVLAGQID